MSMIYCPECGHEISAAAVACPSCGRPLSARPVIERPTVVAAVPRQDSGVPSWIFIPLGIIGAVLLIVFFVVMSRNNDDSNLNVNVSTRRASTDANRSDTSSSTSTTTIPSTSTTVPTTSTDSQTLTVPGTQTGVTSSAPTKGSVTIDAKIAGRTGAPQPVKQEKFYLLDKDVESILSEAGLQSIEGQSLLNSFGL